MNYYFIHKAEEIEKLKKQVEELERKKEIQELKYKLEKLQGNSSKQDNSLSYNPLEQNFPGVRVHTGD